MISSVNAAAKRRLVVRKKLATMATYIQNTPTTPSSSELIIAPRPLMITRKRPVRSVRPDFQPYATTPAMIATSTVSRTPTTVLPVRKR